MLDASGTAVSPPSFGQRGVHELPQAGKPYAAEAETETRVRQRCNDDNRLRKEVPERGHPSGGNRRDLHFGGHGRRHHRVDQLRVVRHAIGTGECPGDPGDD